MKRFLFLSGVLAMASMMASATTFNFTNTSGTFSGTNNGGSCNSQNGTNCNYGDTFTYTVDGITLTATAWNSVNGTSDNFSTAQLFKSGSSPTYIGLGVCNQGEGIHGTGCSDTEGYVDNSGSYDFILFTFNQNIDPTSLTINATIHNDTDIRWWYSNLTTLSGTDPNGLGATSGTASLTGGNSYTATFTGTQTVRSLIMGVAGGQNDDGVKVTSLSLESRVNQSSVPEPGSMALLGSGLLGLGLVARRRRK